MIVDTHAHYDDEAFDADREELLHKLPENGIEFIVDVGASIETTKKALGLAAEYPYIYAAAGVHPSETGELNEENFDTLQKLAKQDKVVAVGEIGLDYHWDEPDREVQKKWFINQLSLAKELKLPVIIHSRDAAKDTLSIMKQEKAQDIGGVIHCFSYSLEIAEEYLEMGFYLGIGGVVTFPNAKKLKEVVKNVPLDRIVLETDCPYLSPVPNRGKRNSSLNLPYVVKEIAALKGEEELKVIEVTRENAVKLYRR